MNRIVSVSLRIVPGVLVCLAQAGCSSSSATDAGVDASPDVQLDESTDATEMTESGTEAGPDAVEEPAPDAGSDATADGGADADATLTTDADAAPDAPPDAPPDASSCSRTVDLNLGAVYVPGVVVGRDDASNFGFPSNLTIGLARVRVGHTGALPHDDMAGNCFFNSQPFSGSTTINSAADYNYGTMTAHQGPLSVVFNYNTAMMHYVADTSMGSPLAFNTDVTFNIAGGPDGPAGMVTGTLPPQLTPAMIAWPTTWSRTADTEVDWDLPTTGSYNDVDAYVTIQVTGSRINTTTCGVPVCAGSLIIPASIMSHYTAGQGLQIGLYWERHYAVPPTSRPVEFNLWSAVEIRAVAAP